MRSRNFVYAAGCALALASCEDGNGPNIASGSGECGEIKSQLHVEDKFRQQSATFIVGEPIELSLRITNHGRAPTKLGYDGCPPIRFVVLDSQDQNVFDSLPGTTACLAILQYVSYGPWETKKFDLEWNQTRSDDGSRVPAGVYRVEARDRSLECRGRLDAAAPFAIQ